MDVDDRPAVALEKHMWWNAVHALMAEYGDKHHSFACYDRNGRSLAMA